MKRNMRWIGKGRVRTRKKVAARLGRASSGIVCKMPSEDVGTRCSTRRLRAGASGPSYSSGSSPEESVAQLLGPMRLVLWVPPFAGSSSPSCRGALHWLTGGSRESPTKGPTTLLAAKAPVLRIGGAMYVRASYGMCCRKTPSLSLSFAECVRPPWHVLNLWLPHSTVSPTFRIRSAGKEDVSAT